MLFDVSRPATRIAPGVAHVPGWVDVAKQRALVEETREVARRATRSGKAAATTAPGSAGPLSGTRRARRSTSRLGGVMRVMSPRGESLSAAGKPATKVDMYPALQRLLPFGKAQDDAVIAGHRLWVHAGQLRQALGAYRREVHQDPSARARSRPSST